MKRVVFFFYAFMCGSIAATVIEYLMDFDFGSALIATVFFIIAMVFFNKIARWVLRGKKSASPAIIRKVNPEELVDLKPLTPKSAPVSPVVVRSGLLGNADRIDIYLKMSTTTTFFAENLQSLQKLLLAVDKKFTSIYSKLRARLSDDPAELEGYETMMNLVKNHLIEVSSSIVSKLEDFDELEYEQRIAKLRLEGKEDEVYDYIRIESEYKEEMSKALDAFQEASLKLDKLILEESRFSSTSSSLILGTLDELIHDTKMQDWRS